MNEDRRTLQEIESDIKQTRRRIDATARELQDHLRPEHLVSLAAERLQTAGAKEFARNLGCSVRDNPLPVMLTGVGLAWLMAASRTNGNGGPSRPSGNGGRSLARAKDDLKDKVADTAENVSDRARDLGHRAADVGHRAAESARRARERAGEGWTRLMERQPLMLGIFGLAAGAALAAWMPPTETEDELIGETSTRLKRRAAEQAREEAARLRQSAEQGSDDEIPSVGPRSTAGSIARGSTGASPAAGATSHGSRTDEGR